MDNNTIAFSRDQKVIKHNLLIQQSKFNFGAQQQKALLYIVSKIKPEDDGSGYMEFNINEFCEICGIQRNKTKTYTDLKKQLQELRDRSMWLQLPNGEEVLCGWFSNVKITNNSGLVSIKLDEEIRPYLIELQSQFTQYNLFYILGMQSKYSIRLYELIKSYEHLSDEFSFKLEWLLERMDIKYERWADIKRRCVDPAISEINNLTDIKLNYTPIKTGKKITSIRFNVRQASVVERLQSAANVDKIINR